VPAEDFLNFIENIGISLTRSKLRMTETTGMNHGVAAQVLITDAGSLTM
jgi:hypothetical protein